MARGRRGKGGKAGGERGGGEEEGVIRHIDGGVTREHQKKERKKKY